MDKKMKKEEITLKLEEIRLNPANPRTIKKQQMDKLKKSLEEFPEMTELRPIVVDENNVILGGNMRYLAMKTLGKTEVDAIRVEGLTEDQKREFIIKDNVPYGEWDWDALANEWDAEELRGWGLLKRWNDGEEVREDGGNAEYDAFVDKFKPKKTTDDCYTPPKVFEVVEKWVRGRYNLGDMPNIRPFKPGGDYTAEDYAGKVVIDNPPFSIFSEIVGWYLERGVRFFLFDDLRFAERPLNTYKGAISVVNCGRTPIVYENGAVVSTCFITNLDPGKIILDSELGQRIAEANADPEKLELNMYSDPDNLLKNLKIAQKIASTTKLELKYGKDYASAKTVVFGGGLVVSDKAVELLKREAEKREAEKREAEKRELCDADKKTLEELNRRENESS